MPIGVLSRTTHRTKPTSSDGRGARTYMQHAPPGSRAHLSVGPAGDRLKLLTAP